MDINFKVYDLDKPFKMPEYATPGVSGLDLYSANEQMVPLYPGETKLIDTNISIEMPDNMEAQVRSRSGLAFKNQVFVLNSPGTVDSSYRGPIGVILSNFGNEVFYIEPQTRIAQLVFAEVTKVNLIEVDELSETQRDSGGFGSTGIK